MNTTKQIPASEQRHMAVMAALNLSDEQYDQLPDELKYPIGKLLGQRNELLAACKGMLANYIELKRIALLVAKSDAPNWVGSGLTAEDDIHVTAVKAAIAKAEGKGI